MNGLPSTFCSNRDGLDPASRVAVVVAHPDDETIGMGGQLSRLQDAVVVVLTDGAPRDNVDARARGCLDWSGYAALRHNELRQAMAVVGIGADSLITPRVPDKEAAFHLVDMVNLLSEVFSARSTQLVMTHSYENGHADHDAVAFAVHATAARLSGTGRKLKILEAPYYHWRNGIFVAQEFANDCGSPEVLVRLDDYESGCKERMLRSYESQACVLEVFNRNIERFREAPEYDFRRPPAGADAAYHRITPEIDSDRWAELVVEADRVLDLSRGA